MKHRYVLSLKGFFERHADPDKAGPMKKYMRDQFEYLGIKSQLQGELHREFIAKNGPPPLDELDKILRDLWSLPQREFQYAAISLLGRLEKGLEPEFITTLEYLIVTKS